MTAILGMRGTGSFDVTGQRPENWDKGILFKYPDVAKLTNILTMLPKDKPVTDPKYHWFEEVFPTLRLKINNGAGYSAAALVLTVDTENHATPVAGAFQVRRGHVLWNERTNERMFISDDPVSDTSITVIRSFGTTAAAAINDDDWLTVLAPAAAEGDDVPTAVNYKPDEINNCTQIFRIPISLTGTVVETDFRTGSAYKNARARASRDYAVLKENSYIFGEYYYDVDPNSGERISTTRGMISQITTYAPDNIKSDIGAISEDEWDGYLEQLSRNGMMSNKIAFCGGTALRAMSTMAKNGGIRMQQEPKDKTYGMDIQSYVTPYGTLRLTEHHLFSKHALLRKNMLILDTEYIEEVAMKGRATDVLKDRQGNGVDGKIDEFFGETGIKTKFSESHMYLTGITDFAP